MPVTATPSFSMNTGSYAAGQMLAISDATPGATIYYIVTGSPTATKYTNPITISSTETVDAVAVASGYAASGMATATFTVPTAVTPTFSLMPGTYSTVQAITLADTTPGATIYYAINGAPTTASNLYNGPIIVSRSETIEAIAVANGYANSAVGTANYTIWPTSALNEWAWMGRTQQWRRESRIRHLGNAFHREHTNSLVSSVELDRQQWQLLVGLGATEVTEDGTICGSSILPQKNGRG